jgi:hypothetical protein
MNSILPLSSRLPPVRNQPPVSDLRREISAWRALVWAYADEVVQAASNVPASWYADLGYSSVAFDRERVGGGTINGRLEVHEDALTIHGKLWAWFGKDGEAIARVVRAAERRQPLAPSITVERVRLVRLWDQRDETKPAMRKHRINGETVDVYCFVEFEGPTEEQALKREADYRVFYASFLAFLDAMPGFPLTRWKITERGLTGMHESLTRAGIGCALRPES